MPGRINFHPRKIGIFIPLKKEIRIDFMIV
jgi:hypothetical protein